MKEREALKMSRQLLWRYRHETPIGNQPHMICQEVDEAFERIDEALAQPKQEPVAYLYHDANSLEELLEAERKCLNLHSVLISIRRHEAYRNETPLYTSPPQRQPLDFGDFFEWASEAGYDVAHTHDSIQWICLNPMTADLWEAWKAAQLCQLTHFESGMTADELWMSNGKLRAELADLKAKRQPLTDEQIDKLDCVYPLWDDGESCTIMGIKDFARAIEAAHGIGIKGEA